MMKPKRPLANWLIVLSIAAAILTVAAGQSLYLLRWMFGKVV